MAVKIIWPEVHAQPVDRAWESGTGGITLLVCSDIQAHLGGAGTASLSSKKGADMSGPSGSAMKGAGSLR